VKPSYRIGIDENGLGSRLGPLIVTGVLARIRGHGVDAGRLPADVARDLGDSKRLVSHSDVRLGEAWARSLVDPRSESPAAILERVSLEGLAALRAPCPKPGLEQCWNAAGEQFSAAPELVERVGRHCAALDFEVVAVRASVICTGLLNQGRERGQSRFLMDLHAMERLVLALGTVAGTEVRAVCGKVGGIGDYAKFFGPLAGRLHVELEKGPARSAYRFPGLGQVDFVRDADGSDPLVMLASLVGKYLRELLMGRIARHYSAAFGGEAPPSGYHDPRTARFVAASAPLRQQRRVPIRCFERAHEHGS
jgi:ribonuclease HII